MNENELLPEETVVPDKAADILPSEPETQDLELLRREVAALKEEKRRRILLDDARADLEARGLSTGFAQFLVGDDRASTRARVEQFERQYTQELRRALQNCPPMQEPRDFEASRGFGRKRGICRMG